MNQTTTAVTEKKFTTKLNITTNNDTISIKTEDENLNLDCRINQTIPFSIEIKREIDEDTCQNVDYDKIDLIIRGAMMGKNVNFTVDGLNSDTVSELLSKQFKDQQDYIQNTYIKKDTEYTTLNSEKKDLEIELSLSNSKVNTLQNELNNMRLTFSMLTDSQEKEIQNLWISGIILTICCCLLIVRQVVDWRKIKDYMGKV